MTHQYESEILNKLMERDGFNIPSSVPPYEAEIKAYLINQVKQAYPKLTDYEAEWLLYNYTKHLPADFPISSVSNVTEASFENVVPFAYQSAILNGNTMVNYFKPLSDVNTAGSICGFQDGKIAFQFGDENSIWGNSYTSGNGRLTNSIKVSPNTNYFVKLILSKPIDGIVQFGNFKESEYSSTDTITLANNKTNIYQAIMTTGTDTDYIGVNLCHSVGEIVYGELLVIPYQGGMENWNIPYFSGMQSVQMPVLKTVGKNLFDGKFIPSTYASGKATLHENVDISYPYQTSTSRRGMGNIFQVIPNTTYSISIYNKPENTVLLITGYAKLEDAGTHTLSVVNVGDITNNDITTLSVTTPSNCNYMIIGCYINYNYEQSGGIITFNEPPKIQFEENSIATTYEPYKSNILTVNEDVTLRVVGNVRDTLDCLTGEVTERIGEIVLDGSENWVSQVDSSWNSDTHISFRFQLNNMGINGWNSWKINCISDKFTTKLLTNDSYVLDEEFIGSDGTALSGMNFNIKILRSRLNGNETVDGFKQWLSQNPITVQYELATESIKTVDLTTINENGETVHFMPLEGTMNVSCSSESIQPTFDMSVPVEATTQNLASFIALEMEE